MADTEDQWIFVSWSKDLSKAVAIALEEWLPNIFDHIKVWVSDTSIDAGARTYDTIASALERSVFGIILVTRRNQFEPWLNYEAGALSTKFGPTGQAQVAPLLIDFGSKADLTSPIKQYQSNLLDEEGIHKLCKTLAPVLGAKTDAAASRVKMFWSQLQESVVAALEADAARDEQNGSVESSEVLPDRNTEEIILGLRELLRRTPDQTIVRARTWGDLVELTAARVPQDDRHHYQAIITRILGREGFKNVTCQVDETLDGTIYASVTVDPFPDSEMIIRKIENKLADLPNLQVQIRTRIASETDLEAALSVQNISDEYDAGMHDRRSSADGEPA